MKDVKLQASKDGHHFTVYVRLAGTPRFFAGGDYFEILTFTQQEQDRLVARAKRKVQ